MGRRRVEAHVEAHAATIVGDDDLDIVLAGLAHPDVDDPRTSVREGVRHRIQKQIGQHLPVRPGIAVHGQVGLALDVQRQVLLAQARAQAHHHLLGEVGEVEAALVRIVAVGRDLLERLDQLGCAVEIGDELRGRVAAGVEVIVEGRAAKLAALDLGAEHRRLALQRRGDREADADGIVDLVRDAGDQTSEGCELFRLDQRSLGLAQIAQRRLGGVLGLAHLLLAALALADIERHGDDPLDLALGVEQRQLVDQPLPHIA